MNKYIISLSILLLLLGVTVSYGQSCTTTVSANETFSTATWVSAGGATCPPAAGVESTVDLFITVNANRDLVVDYSFDMIGDFDVTLGNGSEIIFDNNVDVTVTGNFPMAGNSNSNLTISTGSDIVVTGDMGDPSMNNTNFTVDGTLNVAGTFSAKNNSGFEGSGSISGGTIDLGNGSSCGSPCPVEGGFDNCDSGDSFCTDQSITPIKLLFFKGRAVAEGVELKWATYFEENFDYFSIQRSSDGIEYEELYQVKGNGWSTDINNYSYTDFSPLQGRSYYRLQSVDFDGYTEIFEAVAINFQGQNAEISIYPNPAGSSGFEITLPYQPSYGEKAGIYSMQGDLVKSLDLEKGKSRYRVSSDLNKGVYIVKTLTGERSYTRRLIIH